MSDSLDAQNETSKLDPQTEFVNIFNRTHGFSAADKGFNDASGEKPSFPQALNPILDRLARIKDKVEVDKAVAKSASDYFAVVSSAIEKHGDLQTDPLFSQVTSILGPHLKEVETDETNRKFDFISKISKVDFMQVIGLCRDIAKKEKT